MTAAAFDEAQEGEAGRVIRETLRAAEASPPSEFQHQMGWVLIAFRNAFHHLATGRTLRQAVSMTISEGGDTNTNGAIVGALVGAADGMSQVPPQWVKSIRACTPRGRIDRGPSVTGRATASNCQLGSSTPVSLQIEIMIS